jgi:hypothetical protein
MTPVLSRGHVLLKTVEEGKSIKFRRNTTFFSHAPENPVFWINTSRKYEQFLPSYGHYRYQTRGIFSGETGRMLSGGFGALGQLQGLLAISPT